jgi:hypothetical protein
MPGYKSKKLMAQSREPQTENNMLIKFTNVGKLAGNPIYINSDHIISVYEMPNDEGSLRTIIWGGNDNGSWEVEEGLSEVVKCVNFIGSKICECK